MCVSIYIYIYMHKCIYINIYIYIYIRIYIFWIIKDVDQHSTVATETKADPKA